MPLRHNTEMPVTEAPPVTDDLDAGRGVDDLFDPTALRPARITISRRSPDDVGFREIYVLLDGEEIAELPYGAVVTRDVEPGPHRVRAHNTLFRKTHDILLAPGEHMHFTAVNRSGWGTFGMLGVLGVGPLYLSFQPRVPEGAGR